MGGLTALAFLLRVFLLASKSFWRDEAFSYYIARLDWRAFTALVKASQANMVLYYVLLRGWLHLGTTEWRIRLFSVVSAVATIPVLYAVGLRLVSRRAAWWSALLLTVSAAHVAYAQEARSYALVILLVSLGSLFLLRGLGVNAQGWTSQTSAWDWAGYVVCSAAAVYSHFLALLVIAAQGLSLLPLGRRLPWRQLAASGMALAILCTPAVWFILTNQTHPLAWVNRLNFIGVGETLALLAGNPAAVPFYAFSWWLAMRAGWRNRTSGADYRFWLVVAWLWFPFVVISAVSLYKPILEPRFLLVSLPAAVLLAGAGLEQVHPQRRRLALILILVSSLGGVVYYYTRGQEDWRSATAYVLQRAGKDDALFIAPNYGAHAVEYYRELGGLRGDIIRSRIEELSALPRFRHVWVLVYGKRTDPEQKALLGTVSRYYRLVSEQHFIRIDAQFYEPLP